MQPFQQMEFLEHFFLQCQSHLFLSVILSKICTIRQLTVGNIERISKYWYLKNGAMYSVLCLGVIMLSYSFGFHIPN